MLKLTLVDEELDDEDDEENDEDGDEISEMKGVFLVTSSLVRLRLLLLREWWAGCMKEDPCCPPSQWSLVDAIKHWTE